MAYRYLCAGGARSQSVATLQRNGNPETPSATLLKSIMAVNAFIRRISNSNQQPLLPLNTSYSDAAPRVDNNLAPKARSQSRMASLSEDCHDTLVGLARQESYLQKILQSLLAAQSEGLLSGLGISTVGDEASSAGGETPTSASSNGDFKRMKGVIPVRQNTIKKIGLQGARRGIARALNDLAALKSREGKVMEAQLAETEEDLSVAQRLASKKKGLEHQVHNIENEEASRQVEEFKREEKSLDAEIKVIESKLWEMKARQRHLLGQLEGLDNSIQSKLSSYKAALTLAEKEAKAFLARPKGNSSNSQGGSESIWALPVQRRTLEMANEHFYEEREELNQWSMDIRFEKSALEEGAVMWEDVVSKVTAVEEILREEMQRLPAHQVPKLASENDAADGVRNILKRMESAKSHIESQMTIAEERKWKLLVCCIGAELEAIIEGYEVLQNALNASRISDTVEKDDEGSTGAHGNGHLLDEVLKGPQDTPKPQDKSTESPQFLDRSEDEDDEPGPELLISHMEDE